MSAYALLQLGSAHSLNMTKRKELKAAVTNMDWALKSWSVILSYELETQVDYYYYCNFRAQLKKNCHRAEDIESLADMGFKPWI